MVVAQNQCHRARETGDGDFGFRLCYVTGGRPRMCKHHVVATHTRVSTHALTLGSRVESVLSVEIFVSVIICLQLNAHTRSLVAVNIDVMPYSYAIYWNQITCH